MRFFEVAVGLLLLLAVVAVVRLQFEAVKTEVTNPDSERYQVIPVTTPLIGSVCPPPGTPCVIPTLGPLFPGEKPPSRGLAVP